MQLHLELTIPDHVLPGDKDELAQQASVYDAAFQVFQERNAKYLGLWRKHGAADSLHHARHKLARLDRLLQTAVRDQVPLSGADLDDALDEINYITFFIRNCQEGNFLGDTSEEDDPTCAC